jgi:hypothetical protein
MTTVEEFIELRMSIEAICKQITLPTGQKPTPQTKQSLDEALRQLETLKTMVANDVQIVVAGRLTRELTGLGTKIVTALAKMPVKRKPAVKKAITVA